MHPVALNGRTWVAEYGFDEWLQTVQRAVCDAQEAIRRGHARAMSAMFDNAPPFRVEPLDTNDAMSPLVIPLAQFRPHRIAQIASLEISMDCQMYRRRTRAGDERVVVRVWRGRRRRAPHQLCIRFSGVDAVDGEVRVNGLLLRTLPVSEEA
ncbi:hypothetical protein ACFPZD_05095 [Dyella tabacisoli]